MSCPEVRKTCKEKCKKKFEYCVEDPCEGKPVLELLECEFKHKATCPYKVGQLAICNATCEMASCKNLEQNND